MPVSSHLYHLLKQLRSHDSMDWVLATVVTKFRSSYRQPGATLLVHPDGNSLGLVSGGCLEADIRLNARKALVLNQPRCVSYDSLEEGNIATELKLGCNGRVEILVQPLKPAQRDVLLLLLERMEAGEDSYLLQCFHSEKSGDLNAMVLFDERMNLVANATDIVVPELDALAADPHRIIVDEQRSWSLNRQNHPVRLWVMGGGVDAQPVVKIAASLGWRITLADHRQSTTKQIDFPHVDHFIRHRPDTLAEVIDADAAIIMSHNIELDAAWLARLQGCENLRYIGLLGPVDRKREVLDLAGINPSSQLLDVIHGPMGFDIGGDLPESVALATIAECHQVLFRTESRHQK